MSGQAKSGLIGWLKGIFAPGDQAGRSTYRVAVRCRRCGELIQGRVNLANDLSAEYGESGETSYICRKTLMGEGRCFQRVEIALVFDGSHRVIDREITGGEFVDVE